MRRRVRCSCAFRLTATSIKPGKVAALGQVRRPSPFPTSSRWPASLGGVRLVGQTATSRRCGAADQQPAGSRWPTGDAGQRPVLLILRNQTPPAERDQPAPNPLRSSSLRRASRTDSFWGSVESTHTAESSPSRGSPARCRGCRVARASGRSLSHSWPLRRSRPPQAAFTVSTRTRTSVVAQLLRELTERAPHWRACLNGPRVQLR
jgi:hypothetical protein